MTALIRRLDATDDGGGPAPGGDDDCNMPCSGDPTVMCGAGWRNSVYRITGQVDLDVLQTAVTYTYEGCFVDTPSRELSGTMFNMGDQATVRVCAELCVGYTYFGVQAEQQCFCGDTNAAVAAQESECNSECRDHATGGDTHTICGGSWRNSVYRITAAEALPDVIAGGADETFEYVGCYVDTAERSQMIVFSRFVAMSVSPILKALLLRSDEQRQRCRRQ